MKKLYLFSFLFVVLCTALSFTDDANLLIGRWEHSTISHGESFNFLAVFRINGTFDGFINKKEFVSGVYHMKHDTLYISDATCNAQYQGTYKVEFYGLRDSLRFHVIQDTCIGRREGTNGLLFKNVGASR